MFFHFTRVVWGYGFIFQENTKTVRLFKKKCNGEISCLFCSLELIFGKGHFKHKKIDENSKASLF